MRRHPPANLRIVALVAFVIGWASAAEAQQAGKIPRVGFLAAASPALITARTEAFRRGLKELGYTEGKNIAIEYRWANEKLARLPDLAAELVRLKVDVIVTAGPAATRPAREATRTIPIVMAFDHDPVGSGFVDSLARPGGNITGLSVLAPDISGKQLEFLKATVPGLARVAVFGNSAEPGNAQALRSTERAAEALRLQLHYMDVRSAKDLEPAFRAARSERAGGVLVLSSPLSVFHRAQIAELAARSGLPAIYVTPEVVEAGGLMTYAPSITDLFRRAATYVDKILKGAKPAELPVEQPTNFELVINLKAARQIGLAIPPGVLARADRIIE